MVNRDWVKREREERGAVGLGARHAAKLAGGGAALTVIRWWRCAYRDPVVALRLPPANGCDPFGIEEGGGRFIRPRLRGPVAALRLP